MTYAVWLKEVSQNLDAAFLCAQVVLPFVSVSSDDRSIINIA